jgi:hypothetical protein
VKRGAYLYITTLDDYVQTFKQSTMYYVFLHEGCFKISLDKDELCLCTLNHFGDSLQMVDVIARFDPSLSYTLKIPHLEGLDPLNKGKICP